MALQYGMNITASDMKRLLEQNDKQKSGIRTWRQLFGNASLGYNAQSDAITTDYSDAIAQAYRANFEQNNAILGAGLSTGITKEMLAQSRKDLHTAYETYIRNYNSDMATAAEGYGEEVGAIDTALNERASNFANLYKSAYQYLSEELYGSTFADGANYFDEHGLNWLSGNSNTGELLSWDEMSVKMFNPDGSLNREGVKFFDQIFNATPQGYVTGEGVNTRSFGQWLSDTDNDLYNWWTSEDAFNYNFAGTNKGTSNILTGRESTDSVYGAYEYPDTSGMNDYLTLGFNTDAARAALDKKAQNLRKAKEARKKAKTAKEARKKEMYEGNVVGYNAAADIADREARTAWTGYLSSMGEQFANLDNFFKNKVGSSSWSAFWSENASLKAEYDKLMTDAKANGYYDAQTANNINKWYNNLLKQMNAYIKKYGYDGKTSGF